jgi:thioredoxin reductase
VAVADELLNRGRHVLIVGGQHELALDVGRRAKALVIPRLRESAGVEIVLRARVREIEPRRLLISTEEGGDTWRDHNGPVLVSQGVTPDTRLQAELGRRSASTPVVAVGEAAGEGGFIATALAAGARVAREIDDGRSAITTKVRIANA